MFACACELKHCLLIVSEPGPAGRIDHSTPSYFCHMKIKVSSNAIQQLVVNLSPTQPPFCQSATFIAGGLISDFFNSQQAYQNLRLFKVVVKTFFWRSALSKQLNKELPVLSL